MRPIAAQKYVLIANDLRKRIRVGEFGPKGKIPTERDLCGTYECSRGTIRQGLRSLAGQGLVRSKRGAGTFAVERKNERTSRRIATIVPNVTNSEIARLVHTLGSELVSHGYFLSLYVTNDQVKTEAKIITDMLQSDVAGVFKLPTQIRMELGTRHLFRDAGIPCVVINDFWVDCHDDHHVAYDEQAGVTRAVDHLVRLGHERIGYLDSHVSPRVGAINAYCDALRNHGLPWDDRLMILGDPTGTPALERVYSKDGVRATALITVYDVIAARVMAALNRIGLQVPDDVSVVNINGRPLVMPEDMDLTCAVPPNEQIVAKALDILERWTEDLPPQHALIEPAFHVGHSTGRCIEKTVTPSEGMDRPLLER